MMTGPEHRDIGKRVFLIEGGAPEEALVVTSAGDVLINGVPFDHAGLAAALARIEVLEELVATHDADLAAGLARVEALEELLATHTHGPSNTKAKRKSKVRAKRKTRKKN